METEYIKDLRHNYMVLSGIDGFDSKAYCMKLLEHQSIEGILGLELRRLDDEILIYYDITSRQSMTAILDKTTLTEVNLRKLCQGIINTLERAYEYLLPEENFILKPEYIYIDVVSNEPALCFLPGFDKPIKEQISSLLEYLMNKVDYNDREAVLLVYRLYAVSREGGYTLTHLIQELTKSLKPNEDGKSKQEPKPYEDPNNRRNLIPKIPESQYPADQKQNIPVMMEKLDKEVEIPCYPLKTYLFTAVGAVGGLLLISLGFATRIIYSTYGSRIDYTKLAALLLISFCGEGYVMKMLWDKNNRITKIITKNEYVDPNQISNSYTTDRYLNNKKNKLLIEKKSVTSGYDSIGLGTQSYRSSVDQKAESYPSDISQMLKGSVGGDEKQDGCDNPTCLLNGPCQDIADSIPIKHMPECLLQAIDQEKYQSISIDSFPFFIGKLKKNVDYCIEKDVVSRYHAKLLKEDNRYYLMDMNSTNGTFVNGEAITTYSKREIKQGDEVRFADIGYRVELSNTLFIGNDN